MNTLRSSISSLFAAAAVVVIAAASPALGAGTTNLAGDYNGTYAGQTDSLNGNPLVIATTGPGSVTFTAKQRGKAALVEVHGENVNNTKFVAKLTLRKDGTAHTDAIVPGVANKQGDGTWSISDNGKVITYDFKSSEPVTISIASFATGKLKTHGTIKVAGASNTFSIKGRAKGTANLGLIKGHYSFK